MGLGGYGIFGPFPRQHPPGEYLGHRPFLHTRSRGLEIQVVPLRGKEASGPRGYHDTCPFTGHVLVPLVGWHWCCGELYCVWADGWVVYFRGFLLSLFSTVFLSFSSLLCLSICCNPVLLSALCSCLYLFFFLMEDFTVLLLNSSHYIH